MAKISFDVAERYENSENRGTNDVKFFSLKNDGDTAIVRIMHDSVEDFNVYSYHEVMVDGKPRKVSCTRTPDEPIANCPLCAGDNKLFVRIFINMLQYIPNPDGTVTVQPIVWERVSSSYGAKLRNLINEYGPLSNCIFKIRRNGKAGDKKTTYDIMFGSPTMYPESLYIKDEEAFKNYSVLGTVIMDKNYPELVEYVRNGSFPTAQNSQPTVSQPNIGGATPTYSADKESATAPTDGMTTPSRPTRYY